MPQLSMAPDRRLDTTKFAIIYPRQSTAAQVEQNVYSLETQLQLREVALSHGFPPENVLIVDDDLGVSGRSIEKRIGFSRAMDLVGKGLVGAVYAEDMTRLTRDEDTVDHMRIGQICKRAGCLLYMGGSWIDMRDPAQRQLFKYQAVSFSESWAAHLDKLLKNRRRKASEGKLISRPPRGYRVNKEGKKDDPGRDRAIVFEPEAEVIRGLIAHLPVAGSVRKVYQTTAPLYWPDGQRVTEIAVRKIWENPFYRGVYEWGDIRVEDAHPALLSPEDVAVYERLTDLNRTTERGGPRDPSRAAQIPGLVWCPTCARKMTASTPYYRCSLLRHQPDVDYHQSIRFEVLDPLVLADFWGRLLRGRLIETAIASLERKKVQATQVVTIGTTQRRALEKRRDGYLASLGDDSLTARTRQMLQQQLDQVLGEIEELEAQAPEVRHIEADLAELRRHLAERGRLHEVQATWHLTELRARRAWLRGWIERVDVTPAGRRFDVVVAYRGGVTAKLTAKRKPSQARGRNAEWTEEEMRAFAAIVAASARPARGWATVAAEQMAALGYTRTRRALIEAARALNV